MCIFILLLFLFVILEFALFGSISYAHIHKTDNIYFVSINWENTKNLKLLIPVLFVSVFFRTFAAILFIL